MERSTGLLSFVATGWRAIFAFFQPLYEADGGAGEIPFCTQLVFEETLKVEVQGLLLIGEEQKDRRWRLRLGHVINSHPSGFCAGGALQIHIFLHPAIPP